MVSDLTEREREGKVRLLSLHGGFGTFDAYVLFFSLSS